jgi:outer membrane protein assembly factor BamB
MAGQASIVHTGIKGHVIALDRATGSERWRTKLRGADFVNLASDGTFIFAGTSGEVFCLDPDTGALLWHNPMKGLGFGLVSLLAGSDGGNSTALAESRRRAHARQAAAT